MSLASVAAQQNSTSTASAAAQQTGSAALNSLSANFGDFLKLLMTQLQNQDPTSPLDTNQFTSELVQFSSVEQQINTNTSLTQLIQLTQAGEVMQASSMTGKHGDGQLRSCAAAERQGDDPVHRAGSRAGGDRDLQRHRRQAERRDHDGDQGHEHLDVGWHRQFWPHAAGRQLQGRGGRRERRRHRRARCRSVWSAPRPAC